MKLIEKQDKSVSKLYEMKNDMLDICYELSKPSQRFNVSNIIKSLNEYLRKHGRVLYSELTSYINALDDEECGNFTTNLDKMVEFVLEKTENENTDPANEYKKFALKIWDHAHLVLNQIESYTQTDDEFNKKYNKNIAITKKEISDDMGVFTQNIYGQLVALVGLFTAMAFLVFGGLSSIDNIFSQSLLNVSLLKTMILGLIWGICIFNIIFVFMYFITKLTGNSRARFGVKKISPIPNMPNNKNRKFNYSLVFWCNLILINLLFICMWLYFCKYDFNGWYKYITNMTGVFAAQIIALITIALLDCVLYILIYKKIINKKKNNTPAAN